MDFFIILLLSIKFNSMLISFMCIHIIEHCLYKLCNLGHLLRIVLTIPPYILRYMTIF